MVSSEIKKEFIYYWGKEREDDMVSKENFIRYFTDISFSIKENSDFNQVLASFGYSSQ